MEACFQPKSSYPQAPILQRQIYPDVAVPVRLSQGDSDLQSLSAELPRTDWLFSHLNGSANTFDGIHH